MRDVGVFSAEYSVAGRFINEALAISIYLSVRGYNLAWWMIIGLYLLGLIVMGILGRMLRKNQIPHLTNTLQNELNAETQTMLKDLKLIKSHLGIKE